MMVSYMESVLETLGKQISWDDAAKDGYIKKITELEKENAKLNDIISELSRKLEGYDE